MKYDGFSFSNMNWSPFSNGVNISKVTLVDSEALNLGVCVFRYDIKDSPCQYEMMFIGHERLCDGSAVTKDVFDLSAMFEPLGGLPSNLPLIDEGRLGYLHEENAEKAFLVMLWAAQEYSSDGKVFTKDFEKALLDEVSLIRGVDEEGWMPAPLTMANQKWQTVEGGDKLAYVLVSEGIAQDLVVQLRRDANSRYELSFRGFDRLGDGKIEVTDSYDLSTIFEPAGGVPDSLLVRDNDSVCCLSTVDAERMLVVMMLAGEVYICSDERLQADCLATMEYYISIIDNKREAPHRGWTPRLV